MTNKKEIINSSIKPLVQFIKSAPKKLGIKETITEVELSPLGYGESNISLFAKVNIKHLFVFRIAQLYKDKVQHEFEILRKIPDNLAPKPIYLDTSKKVIPHPFLVESFIFGKNISVWKKESLNRLATALALLHSKTAINKNTAISFTKKLEMDNDYFFKNNSLLAQNNEITSLLRIVAKYLGTNEDLLSNLKYLSLIHGDLNTSNIYLDDKGSIILIDWELAHYNDPAREFSTFFYDDMKYLDWRIHLKPTQKENFLSTYKKVAGLKDDTFYARVRLWQIVDKAGAFIYCNWKALTSRNAKEKAVFNKTANDLKDSLERMIL
jgi:aminoglycoside phosphotransferase (APT) family kinase protein